MARFASVGMHQAASDNAVTKGGRVRGRGSWGVWCLMTECGPQFHPLSALNNRDWEWGDERECGYGGEIVLRLLGSEPLPAQRKALSLPSFSHSFFQRCSHWEPSWLDIIFSSCGLMIAAHCQKLHASVTSKLTNFWYWTLYKAFESTDE